MLLPPLAATAAASGSGRALHRRRRHRLKPPSPAAAAIARSRHHCGPHFPGGAIVADPNPCLSSSIALVAASGRARHCHYHRLQPPSTSAAAIGRSRRHRRPLPSSTLAALPEGAIVVDPDHCPPSSTALAAATGRACHCCCRRRPPPLTAAVAVGRSCSHFRPLPPLMPPSCCGPPGYLTSANSCRPRTLPPPPTAAAIDAGDSSLRRPFPPPSAFAALVANASRSRRHSPWSTQSSRGHHGWWRRRLGLVQSRSSWPRSSPCIPRPSARKVRPARWRNAWDGGFTPSFRISRWVRCRSPAWSASPP